MAAPLAIACARRACLFKCSGVALSQSRNLDGRRVPDEPLSENDHVSSNFVNRNPRNLEQMLLAHKHGGFELDRPSRSYWHRLEFSGGRQHVSGRVVHCDGHTVVRASSSEWGIRRQLVSGTDRSAAAAVARVLARRCLEAGLLCVQPPTPAQGPAETAASLRLQAFLDGMKEGGVLLTESWQPHMVAASSSSS